MPQIRVRAHRRAELVRAYPPSWTVDRYSRGLSNTDERKIRDLIDQIELENRAGYTYTGLFKFDIDNPREMDHVYDKLGPRVMFAIAETNRLARDFAFSDVTIGKMHGIGLWRDDRGEVYSDDVRLHVDIDDEEALRIARSHNQFNILKVDGRTRSFAFLEAPNYDVTIRGEGKDRTFDPRPEP